MSLNSLAKDAASIGTRSSEDAIDKLTKYIPVESLTLYIAAVSASTAISKTVPFITATMLFWFFAIFTPILLVLLLVRKLKIDDKPIPAFGKLPFWEIIASFIAFVAWALAVPENPYLSGDVGGVVAAFLALFVSTILDLLAPFFTRP